VYNTHNYLHHVSKQNNAGVSTSMQPTYAGGTLYRMLNTNNFKHIIYIYNYLNICCDVKLRKMTNQHCTWSITNATCRVR